jgi:hypothetical protein
MFESYEHEKVNLSVHFAKDEVEKYGEAGIPTFLYFVYAILPFWGILWFYFFWNGSVGWLDRGYWSELEGAARTKFVNGQVQKVSFQEKKEVKAVFSSTVEEGDLTR